jgi:hypothetical protein
MTIVLHLGHTGKIADNVKVAKKEKGQYSLERYDIYLISGSNLPMNDVYINNGNPIFETLHELIIIKQ